MNRLRSTWVVLVGCFLSGVTLAQTPGVPWTGEPGKTETVAEIMARQAHRPPLAEVEPHERIPERIRIRRDLPQNPGALPVAQFPPAESSTQLSPQAPQTVGVNFLGAQFSESGFVIPPDSMGDVGPSQFLVCVNGRIRTFTKAGVADGALDASTDVFFAPATGGNGTSDPRVRYDRLTGRWFLTMITVNTPNRILIAVSSTSIITSTSSFTFFQFQHDLVGPTPNADTGGFADYDTLGVDNNALYIGMRMFTSSYIGATGFVVNKAALLANTLTVTAFRQIGTSTAGIYTPQGVHNDDPTATEGYFIGIDLVTFGKLIVRRISTPGGVPSISGDLNITVPTTTNPINPKPNGSHQPLSALDDRLFAAFMHKGSLWTSHNIQVDTSGVASSSGGRDGARWYELINLTNSPTLRQSGTLFDPAASKPRSFWIPSCAMSGQGHMALGCSVGGANEHAEIAVAGRFALDALGTIQTDTVAQTTATDYNVLDGANPHRWGDYSVVTVDPNDDMTMWTVQEYCNAANSWGVRVIQLNAPPPATPATCSPSSVARGTTTNIAITGTVTNGSGFFDPGTGFPNHISAVVNGGSVTVNSVTYNNPTNLTLNITIGATATLSTRTLTVTNPDGQALTSAGILTIIAGGATNSLPVINAASITPSSPSTTNNLLASVTSSFDADSDPITFAYQWQESATNLAGQTANILLAPVTFVGRSYRCVITPNDGHGNGPAFTTAAVVVPVDFDGNGLNDDWEVANFGHIGVNANADPDGDGFSNAKEFAAGTDPNNAASAPLIVAIAPSGNDVVITFASVAGKSYDVQRNDDLSTPGWTTFTNVTGNAGTTQATDVGGALQPQRFYRAQVLP